MRRIVLATSAMLAILALRSFVPNAEAMRFASLASILHASADANLVQDVACRRLYRCGPYGCDWRTVCWADPNSHPGTYYYGYDGPFDYGYGGFYNYYGGVPQRWTRPYRPIGDQDR
jgi:hypothetical protein